MWFSILIALAGLVSPMLFADTFPADLVGKWKLTARHCETGALTKYGKNQQPSQSDFEEMLTVSADGSEEYRLREFKPKSDSAKYCETIYRGKWVVRDGKILKFSETLESRKGIGGYTCYKTTFPKTQTTERDWPYQVKGDRLEITHNDIELKVQGSNKVYRTCESSEHSIAVYERQH